MMAGGRLKRLTEAGEGEGDRHLKLSFSESNLCLRLTMQLRTTHWAFVSDDLREKQMHLSTGGKFPLMRNTIWRWEKYSDHDFYKDHPNIACRGQTKGIKIVLLKRALWQVGLRLEHFTEKRPRFTIRTSSSRISSSFISTFGVREIRQSLFQGLWKDWIIGWFAD